MALTAAQCAIDGHLLTVLLATARLWVRSTVDLAGWQTVAFGHLGTPSRTPHPTSLREATFSHKGRRKSVAASPPQISNVGD